MAAVYTPKQGQYLAFIYYYTKIHGVPPAEADMQRYFRVSAPAVHEMVKTLDRQASSNGSRASPVRSASC
jgi:Mn-dependent DtxR family transcriptional regulator